MCERTVVLIDYIMISTDVCVVKGRIQGFLIVAMNEVEGLGSLWGCKGGCSQRF